LHTHLKNDVLVIKEGKDLIARIVKRIATSYSYYFNKKYKHIGHVFQERYRSENIEDERYLLSVIRYVHRNPSKAGIGAIDEYRWSSYGDYAKRKSNLTDIEDILGMISSNHEKALLEFQRFTFESTEEAFLDIAENKDIDHNNVTSYIKGYLDERGLELNDLKSFVNKEVRNELIETLSKNSNISLRTIAVLLDLNREIVRKSQCQ
jgi:putative transposase